MGRYKDIRIEVMRGKGPGGMHKNKTSSMVRATHIPTGVSIAIDGRNQHQNKRRALKLLKKKLQQIKQQELADQKKAQRDQKIHERDIVRTYNFPRHTVKDHRTGKIASIEKVLKKGRLDLLS